MMKTIDSHSFKKITASSKVSPRKKMASGARPRFGKNATNPGKDK